MRHSIAQAAGTTLAFCLVHSLLASRPAKEAAGRLLGEQRRNAWYRPLYVAVSVASAGWLFRHFKRLPDRTLYSVKGPPRALMQALQLGLVAYGALGVREIEPAKMLGLPGLKAWWTGADQVPPAPEAQGPILGADGRMKATGPFRRLRHPLNALAVPVLWLMPRLTVNGLVFNLIATAYLYLGSWHEEVRLREAYGQAYDDYRSSGTAFFFPSPRTLRRRGGLPKERSLANLPGASS